MSFNVASSDQTISSTNRASSSTFSRNLSQNSALRSGSSIISCNSLSTQFPLGHFENPVCSTLACRFESHEYIYIALDFGSDRLNRCPTRIIFPHTLTSGVSQNIAWPRLEQQYHKSQLYQILAIAIEAPLQIHISIVVALYMHFQSSNTTSKLLCVVQTSSGPQPCHLGFA